MTNKSYQPGWRSSKSRGKPSGKRRQIIRQLKRILPLAIVAVLISIFLWPKFASLMPKGDKTKAMDKILKENPLLENKVIHPKLESLDKKGRPFLVEAKYATHISEDKTEFTDPSGHIILDDGSTLSFKGLKGFYYKSKEMLEIMEKVNVKTDKGYDLKTEYMKLYPQQNIGEGNKPVYGTGPSGETIQAEGFKITDKGDRIEFLGKTTITLPGSQ